MLYIRAKQAKTAIRIKNCIDNRKNLMVLKMMQFGILMTSFRRPHDVIIWHHYIITIMRIFGSYDNHTYHTTLILWHINFKQQKQKNWEYSKFHDFFSLSQQNPHNYPKKRRNSVKIGMGTGNRYKLKVRKS